MDSILVSQIVLKCSFQNHITEEVLKDIRSDLDVWSHSFAPFALVAEAGQVFGFFYS